MKKLRLTSRPAGHTTSMANDSTQARLSGLLLEPGETLDVELKGWLDLTNNNEHKAVLAKAAIALANHGGGYILIGFEETPDGVAPAQNRPATLASYTPDTINSILNRYAEPTFHSDVRIVDSPVDGNGYPIVIVPGGHQVPIRSKRDGPNGQVISQYSYYIRRPGPQSEIPQSGREWDALVRRCIHNAREEILDQFRQITSGEAGSIPAPEGELEGANRWFDESVHRWQELTDELAADHVARLRHGRWAFAYQLFDDQLEAIRGADLLRRLADGVVRHTGWPPFWVPTREGIAPYIQDQNVECWLGPDGDDREPSHCDFWRVSPSGQFFILRGHEDDDLQHRQAEPGKEFDVTLPTWRLGEVLLHAESMARQFEVPSARVVLVAEWTGLEDRSLSSWANRNRNLLERRHSRQNAYRTNASVQADQIPQTLPEIVNSLLGPLYELFNFFELPGYLVAEELLRMREHRF